MKRVRWWLIIPGVLLAIGAAGLVLIMTPGVQRWALLRAAGSTPGLRLEIGTISANFSHLVLQGASLEDRGVVLRFARLEADYSPWQLLVHRRFSTRGLTASGVMVDARGYTRARAGAIAAGVPVAGPGLLARIEAPLALVLDECRLDGRALLPGAAGKPPIEAEFKVTGGRFAPDGDGTLLLLATLKDPLAGARVEALHAQVVLHATPAGQKSFSRVALTAVVDAEGKDLSEQSQLKLAAELSKKAGGENYTFSVDTLLHGVAENVLAVHGELAAGRPDYGGDWSIKARTAQLEPFTLGAALPDFKAQGGGHFTFNPVTGDGSLQGSLEGEASRLEEIAAPLRAIGLVKVKTQFDVGVADGVARFSQVNLQLAGEQPVLELQAARALELNFRERRLQVGDSVAGEALNLSLHGLPLAWVRSFVSGADISGGSISGQLTVTGEADRLLLHMAQPLRVEQLTVVREGELLLSKADLAVDASAILTRDELQVVVKEAALTTPAGDAVRAQANFSVPVAADPPVAMVLSYTADLPRLLNPWLPLGHVRLAGGSDLTWTAAKVQVRQLSSRVTDAAGQELFKLTALRAFEYDRASRRTTAAGAEVARISVGRVPLEALLPALPGLTVSGVVEQGDFAVFAEGGNLTWRAGSPFKLAGVAVAAAGQPILAGLAIEAQPELVLVGGGGWQLQTGDLTIATAEGVTLAALRGDAGHVGGSGWRGSLTFGLEVPTLANQPGFAGVKAVSQGRASGELRVAFGPARQVEARVTLNGLVAAEGGRPLPVANLSLRAIGQEDGRISVQAPLLLDRAGQRSDLNFSFDLVPAGRAITVDGKVTGDQVDLGDAAAVLGVFLAANPTAGRLSATPAADSPAADPVASWSRFNGQIVLDLKSARLGTTWAMSDLIGTVNIDPQHLVLQKLTADLGGTSQLEARAEIGFTGEAQPYSFTGGFSLTDFDTGKFFKALTPDRPPTVEGLFAVTAKFTGTGATVRRTVENTHGEFDLTSRQGVFRGLQRTSNKLSMTSKAVELGASVLGSIFGSDKVTKAAEKVAGQAYFVDQLAQGISEINYDQLTLRLVRDDALNFVLEDISLVSPEIRLIGKGSVTSQPGVPLLEQPLSLTLAIAARGKTEQQLGKLRLLDGTHDDLGFARTREPVTIGGTLAKPDPSAYFARIAIGKFSELTAPDE